MTSQPARAMPVPPPPPPRRRWLTILLMLVILAAGIAIGAGGSIMYTDYQSRYYRSRPDRMAQRVLDRLDKELDFSAEQARRIRPIVDDWWTGWQDARRQTADVFTPHLDRVDQRIRPLLDERQRAKWEAYIGPFRRQYVPATAPAGEPTPPSAATQPD